MNHAFVPTKFDPQRSAYWLSDSAEAAARRLPTSWFWALRASVVDPESDGPDDPPLLFLVASEPSPYPISSASLTLGPRKAQDTGTYLGNDAQLIVRNGPLPSMESVIHEPLYLHTIPALPIDEPRPLTTYYFVLNQDSLRRFFARVREDVRLAREYREHASSTQGCQAVKNGWAGPTEDTSRMGEDPRAYVFDFGPPEAMPTFEGKATVYEELMLYAQLCKDYRWRAVEDTILWTRNMREFCIHGAYAVDIHTSPTHYPDRPLGATKVIVFDLLGAIVDREGAIRNALSMWQGYFPAVAKTHIYRLTERYMTLEGQSEWNAQTAGLPNSPVVSVHQALLSLAHEVDLRIDEYSPLFIRAFAQILNPPPHPEVEAVTHTLLQRGYTLVGLPAHSETTMMHIVPLLPRVFVEHVHLFPEGVSMHFVADSPMLKNLYSFCQSLVGGALERQDILVVSASVGRVLHAAQYMAHATALVQRPGDFEGHVESVVGGKPEYSPRPSVTVQDLRQLAAMLQ
ncbi:hypothetical protein C8Q74DRAFT_1370336 [Fomes fomentarius]|nr:hypothetical protein C8Q74DRAFT_1370336 [Fomes fomentarius]